MSAKDSQTGLSSSTFVPPRPAAPPLLTQQLAPPTPIRFSHSLSAPTTAPPRDFPSQQVPQTASAESAPASPYYNFSSVRPSLPTISPGSYGSSPSHITYSSATGTGTGHDHSHFSNVGKASASHPQTIQHHPPSYPPVSRTDSIISESPLRFEAFNRDTEQPKRLEGLHLPPIRTASTGFGDSPGGRESVKERGEAEEGGKRRRLNISEVLE
ncbi:uncharacterized protein EI97DRAFT_433675 [Westerdykella ornata]|uniref:Uncharacterized protein n=1 Tax=Westerdykella ornata TaxID=318751 RepID=A0A6A6JHY8_WESOR|nr:uncharacterized protein EI97DRAFT_433675 [Westerdykella ornata]KAF2276270.1 hypothetical protein EI97DRAFT_433675 [Westerdykella ornata]